MQNLTARHGLRSSYSAAAPDKIDARRAVHPAETFTTIELIALILLPFSTGYFLSYYLRTVNAVLSTRLAFDLSLDAAELGLVTSAYFFTAALAQLPLGWALDRFGPRRVQSACLLLAVSGAILFAGANDIGSLLIARSLIGLGVAIALLAGLKALALACPRERLGLFNGLLVTIGTIGATTASAPTEYMLRFIDWRQLFLVVALAGLLSACVIWSLVPRELDGPAAGSTGVSTVGYRQIFTDPGFWKLAPLSATTVGSAWALQGLWSGPWLRDVVRFDQANIANHLLLMAIALSMGALSFGLILHRLARFGFAPAHTLSLAVVVLIIAEMGLAFAWPVPPLLLWGVVSAFAAATVMTYTVSAHRFPKESVGRANSALNFFQFGMAFVVQVFFGHVVSCWPRDTLGHYPTESYRVAFLCLIAAQAVALLWFTLPDATTVSGDVRRRTKPASRFRCRVMAGFGVMTAAAIGCALYRPFFPDGLATDYVPVFLAAIVHETTSLVLAGQTELLPIAACGFLVLAFLMSSSMLLRAFALLSSLLFVFYAILLEAHGVLALNAILLAIHTWHLLRALVGCRTPSRRAVSSLVLSGSDGGGVSRSARPGTWQTEAPWT